METRVVAGLEFWGRIVGLAGGRSAEVGWALEAELGFDQVIGS